MMVAQRGGQAGGPGARAGRVLGTAWLSCSPALAPGPASSVLKAADTGPCVMGPAGVVQAYWPWRAHSARE